MVKTSPTDRRIFHILKPKPRSEHAPLTLLIGGRPPKNERMKIYRRYSLFVIVSFFNVVCCSQHRIEFNDSLLYASIEENEITEFVSCLKLRDNEQCIEGSWREFKDLRYEKYLTTTVGDSVRLTAMTERIASYFQNGSYDKFLALTVFLYESKHASKKLYDDMLELCIEVDSTNLIAHYELAKLRFDEGYVGLSFFLIDKMSEIYPLNREISNLRSSFINNYGDDLYNKALDYPSYLKVNPPYIED